MKSSYNVCHRYNNQYPAADNPLTMAPLDELPPIVKALQQGWLVLFRTSAFVVSTYALASNQ